MVFSPLMVMLTLPVETRRERAARMMATSARTITVKRTTPSAESFHDPAPYSFTPEKDMKAIAIRPSGDEGDAQALQAVGNIRILQLFAHTRHCGDRQRPAKAGGQAIGRSPRQNYSHAPP